MRQNLWEVDYPVRQKTLHSVNKVKLSCYRPGVAQTVGRVIALLFHDLGTRRGWVVVRSTPRPHFTPGKDLVPILQEAGWAPGPVWTGKENLAPTAIWSPDCLARHQLLYRLSYTAHISFCYIILMHKASQFHSANQYKNTLNYAQISYITVTENTDIAELLLSNLT
jgi:hypothetical protein